MTRRMLLAAFAAIAIPIRAAKASLLKPKHRHFSVEFAYDSFTVSRSLGENRATTMALMVAFLESIKGKREIVQSCEGLTFFPARGRTGAPRAAMHAFLVDPSDHEILDGGDLGLAPWYRADRSNNGGWSLRPITRAEALGQA